MMAFKDEAEKILPRLTCGESHPGVDVYHPGGHDNPYVDRLTALHEREVERIIGEDKPYIEGKYQSQWDNQLRAEQRRRANGEGEV